MPEGKSVFVKLADGLSASVDGRGWDAEHERLRRLANAAPSMLAAINDLIDVIADARDRGETIPDWLDRVEDAAIAARQETM